MNKKYVYIGIVVVVFIIGYLLIQNSNAKKAAAATAAANANANPYVGGPPWLQVLNSPALISLLGGLGTGLGSNAGKGGNEDDY